MKDNILEINDLSVRLGEKEILKEVSFSVGEGEIVALVGPNGAGKTTLLKAILGLIPYSGDISFSGRKIKGGDIGYVPQYFQFDRSFPIIVSELVGLSYPAPSKDKVRDIMKEVGIEDLAGRMLGDLSGGEIQKALIARSAIKRPKLWLLDEATSGIDAASISGFFRLMEKVRNKWGSGIIMISHEMDIVHKLADKVICLNGSVILEGEPKEALSTDSLEKLYGKEFSFISKK
jgi:zinc transport system ATP-binding protein